MSQPSLATRLTHVRWIAGGTCAGKSTVALLLAARHDALVHHGDLAEHGWPTRITPGQHPHLVANTRLTLKERATRSGRARFETMPSLHGETIGLVVEDVLALPTDRPLLVDWFGNTPRDLAPLLSWREQAVFLLPTPEFRHHRLTARYSDKDRANANWGDADHTQALTNRLARDELWDAELRLQATETNLPLLTIDGERTPEDLAAELATMFRIT
jgi:hypothetical protein